MKIKSKIAEVCFEIFFEEIADFAEIRSSAKFELHFLSPSLFVNETDDDS